MNRIKLADRELPRYSRGEEACNVVSHFAGVLLGVVALVWCLVLANTPLEIITSIVYAGTMILLYSTSSIYHGLTEPSRKKVFQVIDHCTIYLFIAGTYTIVVLCSVRLENAAVAWLIFGIEWALTAVAVTLTAIDLKRFEHFSMTCYIVMGWAGFIAVIPAIRALGAVGCVLLLAGGISYTVGSILYGIGRKKPYFHSVFHVFILLGSVLHLWCIVAYVL
jgi:hemolysin III